MVDASGETTVSVQVVELATEIGGDADRVLDKSGDNEEARNGGNVRSNGLSDLVNDILEPVGEFFHAVHVWSDWNGIWE